jgi:hypothetical protein
MRALLGGCLFAAGLLIAALTGLCTLMFIRVDSWSRLMQAFHSAGAPFLLGVALMIVGVAIIFSGGRRGRY